MRHSISQTKILLKGYICSTWFLMVWRPRVPSITLIKLLYIFLGTHNCESGVKRFNPAGKRRSAPPRLPSRKEHSRYVLGRGLGDGSWRAVPLQHFGRYTPMVDSCFKSPYSILQPERFLKYKSNHIPFLLPASQGLTFPFA